MDRSMDMVGRRDLGRQLRRLRQRSGMSGRQLSRLAAMSQSKISRLETGESVATVEDVEMFCRGLELDNSVVNAMTDRVRELHAHSGPASGWYFTNDPNYGGYFERTCTRYSVSTPGGIPVLLQTEERLEWIVDQMNGSLSERERAQIKIAGLERKLKMIDPGRSFRFLLDGASLRRRVGTPDAHIEQLREVLRLSKLSNVEVRCLPDDCAAHVSLAGWYGVHDADSVIVDGIDLDRASTVPSIVDSYADAFERNWASAFGGEVVTVEVDKVIRDLTDEVEHAQSSTVSGITLWRTE
jgi:transcriptional regulator with XRE-family HTH domain